MAARLVTATPLTWAAPTCAWRTCSWGRGAARCRPPTSGALQGAGARWHSLLRWLTRCCTALKPSSSLAATATAHTTPTPAHRDWALPEEHYDLDSGSLLRFVAECTAEVIRESGGGGSGAGAPPPVVGFCFSFPVEQTALDNGRVLSMTKKFRGCGLLGQDVVQALRHELAGLGLDVAVPAVMNDTVATLVRAAAALHGRGAGVAGAGQQSQLLSDRSAAIAPSAPYSWHHIVSQVALRYSEPDTQLGVIVGTGAGRGRTGACGADRPLAVHARACNQPACAPSPACPPRLASSRLLLCPGTNCAYLERVVDIRKLPPGFRARTDRMVVNRWAWCRLLVHGAQHSAACMWPCPHACEPRGHDRTPVPQRVGQPHLARAAVMRRGHLD